MPFSISNIVPSNAETSHHQCCKITGDLTSTSEWKAKYLGLNMISNNEGHNSNSAERTHQKYIRAYCSWPPRFPESKKKQSQTDRYPSSPQRGDSRISNTRAELMVGSQTADIAQICKLLSVPSVHYRLGQVVSRRGGFVFGVGT